MKKIFARRLNATRTQAQIKLGLPLSGVAVGYEARGSKGTSGPTVVMYNRIVYG